MPKKKTANVGAKKEATGFTRKPEPAEARVPTELSDAENHLLSHMEQGWQLETDSLGGDPVLRDRKTDEVIRPSSANRSTVEALEKRGLIVPGKSGEPLTTAWRMKKAR